MTGQKANQHSATDIIIIDLVVFSIEYTFSMVLEHNNMYYVLNFLWIWFFICQ